MNGEQAITLPKKTLAGVAAAALVGTSMLLVATASNAATESPLVDEEVAQTVAVDGDAFADALGDIHAEMTAARDALKNDEARGTEQWRDGMRALASERRAKVAELHAEFGVEMPMNGEQRMAGEHQMARPDHAGMPDHAHERAQMRAHRHAHAPGSVTDPSEPTGPEQD